MKPFTPTPRSARRQGFTMVEIALCIGIIGFALVAIIGVLPTGIRVQQENREDTLINQDAQYLVEAIRSGVTGTFSNDLTNRVDEIRFGTTNHVLGNGPDQFSSGFEIVGILSRPLVSQRAVVRNISGPASDLSPVNPSKDFAFKYALFIDLQPSVRRLAVVEPNVWYPVSTNFVFVTNHYELHLDFRWPVLPNGNTGNGQKSFRTLLSGRLIDTNAPGIGAPVYHFVPQNYLP
jgi:Flp pilus assembly pilin Flp